MTCNSSIIKAINGHSNVVWSFYLMEPPAGTILSLLLSDNTTKWSYSRDETSVAPLRLGHIYDIQNCCSFWRLVWNLLFLLCNIKLSPRKQRASDLQTVGLANVWAFASRVPLASLGIRAATYCVQLAGAGRISGLLEFWTFVFLCLFFLSADSFWWHQTNRKAAIVLFLMHLLKTGWNQIKYIRKYALV